MKEFPYYKLNSQKAPLDDLPQEYWFDYVAQLKTMYPANVTGDSIPAGDCLIPNKLLLSQLLNSLFLGTSRLIALPLLQQSPPLKLSLSGTYSTPKLL